MHLKDTTSYLVTLHCIYELFDSVAVVGQTGHTHQASRRGNGGGGGEET